MKARNSIVVLGAVFVLGSSSVLAAGGQRCSTAVVAGAWGYTKTGTLVLPTGAVPFASVGRFVLQEDGSMSGVNDGSVGGNVSTDILNGTFTVSDDCTGTMTVEVSNESGTLLRTLNMGLVFVEDAKAARGIVTSLVLPNGTSLPVAITADAKRVSRSHAPAEAFQ